MAVTRSKPLIERTGKTRGGGASQSARCGDDTRGHYFTYVHEPTVSAGPHNGFSLAKRPSVVG
jgi:hypothetical protein